MRVWPGQPYPLGATWDGQGVNFAIFSESATAVELCLFNHQDDAVESDKILLRERTDQVGQIVSHRRYRYPSPPGCMSTPPAR